MALQYEQYGPGFSFVMERVEPVSVSLPLAPYPPIKHQRLLRGWTLQEVADKLYALCLADGRRVGINADVVGRWERGCSRPSKYYQKYLCKLYGLDNQQLGLLT